MGEENNPGDSKIKKARISPEIWATAEPRFNLFFISSNNKQHKYFTIKINFIG